MGRTVLACLAIVCLCCCTSVLANDLITTFTVVDCDGRPVSGATVRITGCVDFPMYATTDASGMAITGYGSDTSIQYCYGIADNPCVFEVVSSPTSGTYPAQSLVMPNGTANASPKDYICQAVGCCHPCGQRGGDQEPECTNMILVGSTIDFVPVLSSCPSSPPPPPPGTDVSGDTCFAFFPALYAGAANLNTVDVVSVSLRDDQKNDDINNVVLTSGNFALNKNPTVPPFVKLAKNNRWGWQQLFNKPAVGKLTKTGIMYCGQNKPGGTISITLDGSTLIYEIVMSGTAFTAADIHVYAGCSAWAAKSVAPGQFNCNPTAQPSSACTKYQLPASSPQAYKASIDVSTCGSKVFAMFHMGL